jgi:hypothetical protein
MPRHWRWTVQAADLRLATARILVFVEGELFCGDLIFIIGGFILGAKKALLSTQSPTALLRSGHLCGQIENPLSGFSGTYPTIMNI